MNLHQISLFIFLLLITLLVLLAIWPTPEMITLVSLLTGMLVLLQVYLILTDPNNREKVTDEEFYQQ